MVNQNMQAVIVTGSAGAGAIAQLVAVKQLVDKTVSIKPLGSFQTSVAKGLNEWSTISLLAGGAGALAYLVYDLMYKKGPLSDVGLALGSYSIVALTGGIVNAFLDPLGNSGVNLNLGNLKSLFSGATSSVSSAPSGSGRGKFVR